MQAVTEENAESQMEQKGEKRTGKRKRKMQTNASPDYQTEKIPLRQLKEAEKK